MKTILAIFLLIFGNGKTFFSEHFQESKHFSVQKSNVISFKIDPQNAYISDGKPPKLLNVY